MRGIRMQPEQYFRDGKQYFELDRARITTTERLQRLLAGLLLAGLCAPWRFRRRLGMEYYLAAPAPPPRMARPARPPESGYACAPAGVC